VCYAIPGQVVALEAEQAVVDFLGDRRRLLVIERDGLEVGDFVYGQGGVIVSKLPALAARRILESWREALVELDRLDAAQVAAPRVRGTALDDLLQRAARGEPLERGDVTRLLQPADPRERQALRATANQVRRSAVGNASCVHGVLELSSHCVNDCAYCGLRRGNLALPRYRMSHDEVVTAAARAVDELGFKALVLQSGEDPGRSTDALVALVRNIRRRCAALLIVSVGAHDVTRLERLHEAGVRGLLMRFETSNPSLYAEAHRGPKANLTDRLDTLRHARGLGWVVATGALLGLPGQTVEHVADDLLLTRELGADMISLGPLVPHPLTPLADAPPASVDLALDAIAVARLMNPRASVLVTTALETLAPEGRRDGLLAGANSLMIDVTPDEYRARYDLYPGKARPRDVRVEIAAAIDLLRSLGRAPTDLGA
jgi:biotin synthase